MHLCLKVDVDTLRGTREGVPRLLDLLARHDLKASFLFSLGPDHTGRAIKRIFRPGFFSKVQRTSVLEHYGLTTLLYGTLLPGPDIGRRGADVMRATRDAGHESGIHTWDHILWQDAVRERDSAWTLDQMQAAQQRYQQVFGADPVTHGAAGWQMNGAALRLLDAWQLPYASDVRGTCPFVPQLGTSTLNCVQLPTTLPTLDELIGIDGRDGPAAAAHLLALTASAARHHVYTLHSELEGSRLLPVFDTLLKGWRDQGYTLGTMADTYGSLDRTRLPHARIRWGSVAGRSGELLIQDDASPAHQDAYLQ